MARLAGRIAAVALLPVLLSGCIATVATIVIDAERARLADLERFRLEVASRDCAGLTGLFAELQAQGEALNDLDQRSDIIRDAMLRDGCALPEGLD